METVPRAAWSLRYELKDWQMSALAEWRRAGRRGVIAAATGSGKTAVALAAIEELRTEHDRLRVDVSAIAGGRRMAAFVDVLEEDLAAGVLGDGGGRPHTSGSRARRVGTWTS